MKRYNLQRDDMPLLSQWINKKGTFAAKVPFFVAKARLKGAQSGVRTTKSTPLCVRQIGICYCPCNICINFSRHCLAVIYLLSDIFKEKFSIKETPSSI
ncbi:MAG: hypothetical protein J6T24_01360, partial [Clostridia bacterium]|nr:hypothetical protein [Clostridia bacterium]